MDKSHFKYRVSVIIPVYNSEKFLSYCLESLMKQSFDHSQMEILLIIDGSTDKSTDICNKYAEADRMFSVTVKGQNKGVSAARNIGLKMAQGEYIMFLDSDDSLSPDTVKNVIDFFDGHKDEVDVVSYLLKYVTGKGVSYHQRYDILTHTGIYDLDEYPYICQSTMNICIKNRGAQQILFNQNLHMAEDQLFVTENLLEKGKLGYVKEACYNYYKHGDNQSNKSNHPYYALDQIFLLFETLLSYQAAYPHMSKYLQSMVVYNINWRMRQNLFYTHHFMGDELDKITGRYVNVFNQLDNRVVLNFPQLLNVYKFYIISQKTENKPTVSISDGKISLLDVDGTVLTEEDSVALGVTRCQFEPKSDAFYIQAFIQNYAIDISGEDPKLYAEHSGEKHQIELYPSGRRYYNTDIEFNHFRAFHYKLNLSKNIKELKFYIEFKGQLYPVSFEFQDVQPVQPKIKRNVVKGRRFAAVAVGDHFEFCGKSSLRVKKIMLGHLMYLFRHDKAAFAKRMYCIANRIGIFSRIWLYNDSYSCASDNGSIQFKHDFDKKDGVKRYYIYEDENLIKGQFTPEQQRYLVKFRSKKHKRLYIRAEKVLTSFLNFNSYVPFTSRKSIVNFIDMAKPEIVYMQHGVLHAKIPNLYHKENSYLGDRVVVSTHAEYDVFTNKLGYRKEDIITSGMPRLDFLSNDPAKKQNKILFAPSWRAYLIGPLIDSSRVAYKEFDTSEYFTVFNNFLNSTELNKLLEENDLTLDVKMHPIFNCYKDKFEFTSKRIRIAESVDLAQYKLCITDFSSYIFDLVYLHIPIVMFMPDKEKFRAGLHSYREFYMPLEDSFGEYTESAEDCINAIKRIIANNYKAVDGFAEKSDSFFISDEPNHRDKLYDSII